MIYSIEEMQIVYKWPASFEKEPFGRMQKVQTQTSRRVSNAASGQGLHILYNNNINGTYISCYVNNFIMYRCFQHCIWADLSLHYV